MMILNKDFEKVDLFQWWIILEMDLNAYCIVLMYWLRYIYTILCMLLDAMLSFTMDTYRKRDAENFAMMYSRQ